MNQYRRIVSYLYKYDNGKKGENTGFVRIDTRPEGIRLHFRMKDPGMMDEKRLKVYFYFHRENRLQLVFVDEFLCARGNCEYKKVVFPDFTDSDFEKMNGVVFLDQKGLVYGSCWDEREISDELILTKEEQQEEIDLESAETISEKDVERKKEESETLPAENVEDVQSIDILSEFPNLVLEGAENTVKAVEIKLQDISKLPSREWLLAENAFLKQAYDVEQHLLLGKILMPNESWVWILGVPGTYDNREKYLAGIFGFHDYIGKENREFKTGGKGYWIREITPLE